ncbi:MAG: TylF/MycF family methyltransferase, partial [Actinomycetota bacterium]|nr:TylF/MycF family methyltransferase [Actinomycetota bacterium]
KYAVFSAAQDLVSRVSGDKVALVGPTQYNEDGVTTVHASPFLEDPLFREAYALGRATRSWDESDIRWRCYVCCWAAWHAKQLPGELVECGVNRGGYSRAIAHYIDLASSRKRLYLLDTFSGLVERYLSESERERNRRLSRYVECYEDVIETFRGLPVRIIRGAVPDSLSEVDAESIAYLSLDMNSAMPELAALRFFWPRLVSGAVVVHDDYGFSGFEEQRHAMDGFASELGLKFLQLPTGQGLLFKP